jgi:hypothetical protein
VQYKNVLNLVRNWSGDAIEETGSEDAKVLLSMTTDFDEFRHVVEEFLNILLGIHPEFLGRYTDKEYFN